MSYRLHHLQLLLFFANLPILALQVFLRINNISQVLKKQHLTRFKKTLANLGQPNNNVQTCIKFLQSSNDFEHPKFTKILFLYFTKIKKIFSEKDLLQKK